MGLLGRWQHYRPVTDRIAFRVGTRPTSFRVHTKELRVRPTRRASNLIRRDSCSSQDGLSSCETHRLAARRCGRLQNPAPWYRWAQPILRPQLEQSQVGSYYHLHSDKDEEGGCPYQYLPTPTTASIRKGRRKNCGRRQSRPPHK